MVHFVLGVSGLACFYLRYINPKEHEQKVFQLTNIEEQAFTMEHRPILEAIETIQVPLCDLKKWKPTKNLMSQLCDAAYAKAGLPMFQTVAMTDYQKAQVSIALHHAHKANAMSEKQIAFTIHPTGLVTLQDFKKGQLKLVPLGHVSHFASSKTPQLAIHHFSKVWAITPWKQDAQFEKPEHSLVPFFWVKKTKDPDTANLQWSTVTVENMKIPILTTAERVAKHTFLLYNEEEPEEEDDGTQQASQEATAVKGKKRKSH